MKITSFASFDSVSLNQIFTDHHCNDELGADVYRGIDRTEDLTAAYSPSPTSSPYHILAEEDKPSYL